MKKVNALNILIILTVIFLLLITIIGILSFNTDKSYLITNQYGQEVRIFGSGIYAHDSYFKAPIFIGSDLTMLVIVVPMLIAAFIKDKKNNTIKSKLFLTSVLAVVFYYAVSMAFGVTYNIMLLIYIALFSCSFFALIMSIMKIDTLALQKITNSKLPPKGIGVFLILSGISIFIAWLPDIISTVVWGTTLPSIEVYTTDITYVLDMGLISPIIFIGFYLLKKKNGLGIIILAIILMLFIVIGVMIPVQTIVQLSAGIAVPIEVLITKVGTFDILAAFALYFNIKLYRFMFSA